MVQDAYGEYLKDLFEYVLTPVLHPHVTVTSRPAPAYRPVVKQDVRPILTALLSGYYKASSGMEVYTVDRSPIWILPPEKAAGGWFVKTTSPVRVKLNYQLLKLMTFTVTGAKVDSGFKTAQLSLAGLPDLVTIDLPF